MRDYHLIMISILCVFLGAVLAWYFDDPHIFERFGALISGLAALFVIVQIKYERLLEQETSDLAKKAMNEERRRTTAVFLPPSLETRVREKLNKDAKEKIVARRMRFVFIVASVTLAGEVVHGFGEIIFNMMRGILLIIYHGFGL